MKKVLKSIFDWFVFLLTGRGPIANEMVDEGLLDLSGQGKGRYGK